MINIKNLSIFTLLIILISSCVSTKKHNRLLQDYQNANIEIGKCGESLNEYMNRLAACQEEKVLLESEVKSQDQSKSYKEEQIEDLKAQIADLKAVRDRQQEQVGDLTVLSKSANDNIKETLSQLENKDKYIRVLQEARTKADSINLALSVNLKGVLAEGIQDRDIDIKVDKTVVFINLSDKMLYQSGSANLTPKANEVLGKIAQIVATKPNIEVMVEGYTDNIPIRNSCIEDNWDLSVKRATSVVRVLQKNYGIDPNKLIAAGRGEYNMLASNETAEGRSANRRTRIIILPKLNEFYDLLNPENNANKID